MANLATSAPGPITPMEVLPALHPAHQPSAYPQILGLCQSEAWGQLAQLLTQYRSYLLQEFNQGAIACSVDQHVQLDASLRQLEHRAGNLVIALQQNTASLDANTATLGYNTHQLSRLNDNLETYLSQPQQPQQQQPIYIVNEVHAHGGDGGHSQSSSESETDGWGYGGDPLWQWAIAVVVLLIAAVAITHSRPQPGPMRVPNAPAQQVPIDGAIAL